MNVGEMTHEELVDLEFKKLENDEGYREMENAFQEAWKNAYEEANTLYEDEEMRNHYINHFQLALEQHTSDTYNSAYDAAYAKYTNEGEEIEEENAEEESYFSQFVNWITGPSRGASFLQ